MPFDRIPNLWPSEQMIEPLSVSIKRKHDTSEDESTTMASKRQAKGLLTIAEPEYIVID